MESKTPGDQKTDEPKEESKTIEDQNQEAPKEVESYASDEDEIKKSIIILQRIWPEPGPIANKQIKDLKVLVVDDQSSMRTIIKNILKDMKFKSSNIEEAVDGRKAVTKLKTNRVDLIISDWIMPNLSGLQLLKIVKSVPGLKNIPFLSRLTGVPALTS